MKLTFLLCIITAGILTAQTKISGSVVDTNGAPILMANITIINTYDGASTNADGKFEFETAETSNQTLSVTFLGFREFKQPIVIDGKDLHFDITLEEEINELKAVVISAGSFSASDESRRTVFKALDIATTAGATADIAGALNTLPGTTKVAESGRLFVRGGEGRETRTFIDGMVVLDAYSPSAPNTPSRGRFLPFMFKGTSFSTGGYSAEFGQALSSALALDSRDNTETTRTDIGLLSVGGDVAHTHAWERGSIAGKLQYTNLQPYMRLVKQAVDWVDAPSSLEAVSAFRQKIGKHSMIKFFANFNNSEFALKQRDIDDDEVTHALNLQNDYRYSNASYRFVLNPNWIMKGGMSCSYVQNKTSLDETTVKELEKGIHKKIVFEGSLKNWLEIKTGAELLHRDYAYTSSDGFREIITATFAEADVYASNNFVTRVGLRSEYNNLLSKVTVDPRISLAYKTSETGQVSLAYGRFRQSAENQWLRQNSTLKSEQAEHYILNYQHIVFNRTFRIETYYKAYDKLVKFSDATSTSTANNGSGYARGLELFWRDNKSLEGIDYWLSYSLLDTRRDYLNYPVSAIPSFASKHNFSAVVKYFVQHLKSQVGATYSYASGRTYFNPNNINFMSDRTKDYSDLSINLSYLPTPSLIIHFSCTNVLGRENVFGYEYGQQPDETGVYNSRPIGQSATRFLFMGVFVTLSKDKSVNQLPTL